MDPFELSRSPYFNDVIRAAREAYEDPAHRDVHGKDLAERLKFMAEFAELLARRFAGTMKVRPKTALSRAVTPRVEKGFADLKDAMRDLQAWFGDHAPERLSRGCARGRQAVEELFDAFGELRKEEETFPVFSRSPFVQELVRVAMGVAKGEFPPDALKEKLEWMQERYRDFRKDFASWSSAPSENAAVDELLPLAAKALDRMGASLEEMGRYLKDRNRDHLKVGCEMLLQAGEVLMNVQEELLRASVPQGVACPRCAADNPTGVRACSKCGATLPEIAGLPTQTMEVRETGAARPQFAHLVRLETAVEGALQGTVDRAELRKHVEWFAAKARQGRKGFQELKAPDSFPSEDARRIAMETRDLMDRGTKAVVEGVERLEKHLADGEREHLERGMERIREGADLILQAQERAQGVGAVPG